MDLKFEELRPGDLIFYSGKQHNPKVIVKHNMMHVEVFLGGKTGEKAIGSRPSLGQISYHDSYKIFPKRYTDVEYHFKSLDTWLNGICKSWCPEHNWRTPKFQIIEGNNKPLIAKYLCRRGLEEVESGMRMTDKAPRWRWTNKPSEISYKYFEEGKHVANHISNSSILTNKSKFMKAIRFLDL